MIRVELTEEQAGAAVDAMLTRSHALQAKIKSTMSQHQTFVALEQIGILTSAMTVICDALRDRMNASAKESAQ